MKQELLLGLKFLKINLDLSKTEALFCLKAYFETELLFCEENVCLFKVRGTPSQILNCLERLAFAKEAYVFSDNFSKLTELAKIFKFKYGKDSTFKILLPLSQKGNSKIKAIDNLANKILKTNVSSKISLSSPDLTICEFINYIGLLIWSNKDSFSKRRTHLKPAPHPSGINPRLAKAMINLAGSKKEVYDPFCGGGGILEEVSLLGLKYIGTDISWKMINLARLNMKSKENLFCMDAFKWDKPVECIVTDLPYGKNTRLNEDLTVLIRSFFKHFKQYTKKAVVCCPNTYDLSAFSKNEGWILVFHTDIYVHGSLTRRIHVFERVDLFLEC